MLVLYEKSLDKEKSHRSSYQKPKPYLKEQKLCFVLIKIAQEMENDITAIESYHNLQGCDH